MLDHLAHLRMYPVDHVQLPYSRPQQPSVHTMAYLSTHTCLTDRQMVSGPMALAELTAAHHLHASLVRLQSLLSVQPCYIYRSPLVHPGTYETWSLDPIVQHAPQPKDHTG